MNPAHAASSPVLSGWRVSVVGSSQTALKETPGRLDPLGPPRQGRVVVEDVSGAGEGHCVVMCPEHPLKAGAPVGGGGTTVGEGGGTCP